MKMKTTSCDLDMQGIKMLLKQKNDIIMGKCAISQAAHANRQVSIHKKLFSISLICLVVNDFPKLRPGGKCGPGSACFGGLPVPNPNPILLMIGCFFSYRSL